MSDHVHMETQGGRKFRRRAEGPGGQHLCGEADVCCCPCGAACWKRGSQVMAFVQEEAQEAHSRGGWRHEDEGGLASWQ